MMHLLSAIAVLLSVAVTRSAHSPGYGSHGYHFPSPFGYGQQDHGPTNCRRPSMRGLKVTPMKDFYDDGETIDISCEDGYELKAMRTNSTCRVFDVFGRYGVFMPAITPKTCQEIPVCRPPVGNGVMVSPEKATYEIGENITVSCKEGFDQIGDESYTCTKMTLYYGGHETASFGVTARQICSEIRNCSAPRQTGLQVEPQKTTYIPGENITLSCENGYELTVESVSVCQKSGHFEIERKSRSDQRYDIWQGRHFIFTSSVCKKKTVCRPPEYAGLVVTPMKDSYDSGEEITLSCSEGYELTKPDKSVCGYQEYHDDFDFFGYMHRMFAMGQFEPRVTSRTCVPKPRCFAPWGQGLILNPEKQSYEEGEFVEISCDDGYELAGNMTTSTCMRSSRNWNYHRGRFQPEPREFCKKKKSCKPPRSRGLVLTPEKTAYNIGEIVEVSCAPGYILKGESETVCESEDDRDGYFSKQYGKFSPSIDGEVCERIPSCDKPDFEGLVLSPEKSYYEIGDKVSVSCEDGYEQRVAPTSTCMRMESGNRGEFDPDLGREPCRKPTSCKAPSDENLIVTPMKESYAEGEEITLACEEGYTLIAAETMTCERVRYWRGDSATGRFHPMSYRALCIKTPTCRPPSQRHLIVSPEKKSYEVDEEVTLSCEEGYSLSSSRYETVTCKPMSHFTGFTVFSPSLPWELCRRRLTCDAPKAQPGLILTPQKEQYYKDEVIQLSCEEGYELIGQDSTTCAKRETHRHYYYYPIRKQAKMVYKPSIRKPACKKIEEDEEETDESQIETEEPTDETEESPETPTTTKTTLPPTETPFVTEEAEASPETPSKTGPVPPPTKSTEAPAIIDEEEESPETPSTTEPVPPSTKSTEAPAIIDEEEESLETPSTTEPVPPSTKSTEAPGTPEQTPPMKEYEEGEKLPRDTKEKEP